MASDSNTNTNPHRNNNATGEQNGSSPFKSGLRDGIPIGLGYFAVGFSLGVFGRSMGITPLQALISSFLTHASAGQYAIYALMGAGASIIEIAMVAFIANARYMLMSAALAQRLPARMPYYHRFILGNFVTDEIFGVTISRPGAVDPLYTYGAICVASPSWAIGTTLGVVAGSTLPPSLTSALSVALYGMFIAIIIPAAAKDKIVALSIFASFAASYALSTMKQFAGLSEGSRTIILTVGISAIVALLFPREEEHTHA